MAENLAATRSAVKVHLLVQSSAELKSVVEDLGQSEAAAAMAAVASSHLTEVPKSLIDAQMKVERFLRRILGDKLLVKFHRNRSTMLSYQKRNGVLYVRLHMIFALAPRQVLGAVALFLINNKPEPQVSALIERWIEAHRDIIKPDKETVDILPRGEIHDLQQIYDELNNEYFNGKIDAKITWSNARKTQKQRTTMRMGSYSEDERLIRIHPALDRKFVPKYFVASVVYHEMLHQVHGAHKGPSGQRQIHPPRFREDERKFRFYERARAWERKNVKRLLQY